MWIQYCSNYEKTERGESLYLWLRICAPRLHTENYGVWTSAIMSPYSAPDPCSVASKGTNHQSSCALLSIISPRRLIKGSALAAVEILATIRVAVVVASYSTLSLVTFDGVLMSCHLCWSSGRHSDSSDYLRKKAYNLGCSNDSLQDRA